MSTDEQQEFAGNEQRRQSDNDISPSIKAVSFSCPHCGARAHQFWFDLYASSIGKDAVPLIVKGDARSRIENLPDDEDREYWLKLIDRFGTGNVFFWKAETSYLQTQARNLYLSRCYSCNEIAVWVHDRLLYPVRRTGPTPNEDLPEHIRATYNEARSILNLSPRGSAGLLRLCIQNLCIHLGEKGENLNDDIGKLVEKGLDPIIQKALDVVRATGNKALHPGQIDLSDDEGTATQLFTLVNLIAEKMISEPKHIDELYENLPQSAKDAIDRRDKGTKKTSA